MSTPPVDHKVRCASCGSRKVVKQGRGTNSNDGRQRWVCREPGCGKRSTAIIRDDESTGIDKDAVSELYRKLRAAKGIQRYVVTGAQNATPVNKKFFESLLGYCKHNKAQLIVVPYRYKNPTSHWSKAADNDDWWAPELTPYLLDRRLKLNDNLTILGDIKTQPTANSPLQGFEAIAGQSSAIIAHPKLELSTVPTPQSRMPKIITTTGAVTAKNYTPTKAGKKGEFHHTFGACVVEVHGKAFHMRQLNAVKDGSFMDLRYHYAGSGRIDVGFVSALVMGDSHIEFIDPAVSKATFGEGGMIDTLRPLNVVWHDAWDGYARNHHHEGEAFINFVKHHSGTDDVEAALDSAFDFIDKGTRKGVRNVFVPSNHPDVLAKWVKRADWRGDPRNAKFLLRTALAMLEGSKLGDSGASTICPFVYWARRKLKTARQALFLERDQSYQVSGVELAFHGDVGANGARGTRRGFSKIGVKVVIGHSHSPGICEGAYQVGTNSRLRLGYNSGPSSWLHTDCVVYQNGKRSLIHIIDGNWRA